MCVFVCVCVCMYVSECKHVCMCMFGTCIINALVCTRIHVCIITMYMYVHSNAWRSFMVHIHVYIHVRTCIIHCTYIYITYGHRDMYIVYTNVCRANVQ